MVREGLTIQKVWGNEVHLSRTRFNLCGIPYIRINHFIFYFVVVGTPEHRIIWWKKNNTKWVVHVRCRSWSFSIVYKSVYIQYTYDQYNNNNNNIRTHR